MLQAFAQLEKNLKRNNMTGHFVESPAALLALLQTLIPAGATVGSGSSVTLEDCGVFSFLREGDYTFYDKFDPSLSSAEKHQLYRTIFSADVFLTGTSALTMEGYLYNIDGRGNRVAPMIYGPDKVIVVVGANKIVADEAAASERLRTIAAPMDTVRLGFSTPCVKLGYCTDCNHKDRICNNFVTIKRQFYPGRMHVIVIEGNYGY